MFEATRAMETSKSMIIKYKVAAQLEKTSACMELPMHKSRRRGNSHKSKDFPRYHVA